MWNGKRDPFHMTAATNPDFSCKYTVFSAISSIDKVQLMMVVFVAQIWQTMVSHVYNPGPFIGNKEAKPEPLNINTLLFVKYVAQLARCHFTVKFTFSHL